MTNSKPLQSKPLKHRFELPKVRLWVVAATLVAGALMAYYAVLGYRYWSATGRVSEMTQRIDDLQSERLAMASSMSNSDTVMQDGGAELQVQENKFDISGLGDMLTFLTTAAAGMDVWVLTVTEGDPSQLVEDGVSYTSLPVQMDVQGEVQHIFSFVDFLLLRAPSMEVVNLRFVSLEGTPLAQLEMAFHTSPKPVSKGPAPAQNAIQADAATAVTQEVAP